MEVWRSAGLGVWRSAGLQVWRFGGLEVLVVWRSGGLDGGLESGGLQVLKVWGSEGLEVLKVWGSGGLGFWRSGWRSGVWRKVSNIIWLNSDSGDPGTWLVSEGL